MLSYKVNKNMTATQKDNWTKDKEILRNNLGLRKDIAQRIDQ